MNGLADLFRPFSESVGGYWSDSNHEFDKTNPNFLERSFRTLNPITGVGSAVGSMYDYANRGDLVGMGLSTASAMPLLAYTKAIPKNLMGESHAFDLYRLLNSLSAQVGINEVENQYSKLK